MFKRFNNIDSIYEKSDFHIHTSYTDGKNTLPEMVETAFKKGLNLIGITDHSRQSSDYFTEYFDEIDKLKTTYSNLKILKGTEVRISNFQGNIDINPKYKNSFDIIIASVHRYPFNEKLFKAEDFKKEISFEIEKELCIKAINKGGFNILGHAGGMSIEAFGEFPYFEDIISKCTQKDIAFEINDRYHKNYKKELYELLRKYNPYVTFGSDAHDIESIRCIDE